MRESDRRVKYTKMVLRESMLELLQTKPINRISVTELCQNADVNRGTFYAHYSEPFELLLQIENDLYDELYSVLSTIVAGDDMDKIHRDVIYVLNRNREICRVILGENGNLQFVNRIMDMAKECLASRWATSLEGGPESLDYIFRYLSAGSVSIIRKWLLCDEQRSPDEIAGLISGLNQSLFKACMKKKTPETEA